MLPPRVPPQLLTASPAAPEGDGWLHEVKYDGYRMLCRVEHGRARLCSRPGNDWTPRLAGVAAAVERLGVDGAYLDGELVALGPDGVPDFDALRRAIAGGRGALPLAYQAFDVLYAEGRCVMELPLLHRKRILAELVRGRCAEGVIRYVDHLAGSGPAFHQAAREARLEGIVSKRAASRYRPGVRSRDWQKVKCYHRYTFRVAAVTREEARLVDDQHGCYAGAVPLYGARPVPDQVVEVKALPWTPGRKLRHATLIRS